MVMQQLHVPKIETWVAQHSDLFHRSIRTGQLFFFSLQLPTLIFLFPFMLLLWLIMSSTRQLSHL